MVGIGSQKPTDVGDLYVLDRLAARPRRNGRRSEVRDFLLRKRTREESGAAKSPAGGKNPCILRDQPLYGAPAPICRLFNPGFAVRGRIEARLGSALEFIGGGARMIRAVRLRIAYRE